jgi:hypothetical protein
VLAAGLLTVGASLSGATTTRTAVTVKVTCPPGSNLQTAINNAGANDTIRIEGTCVGNFTVPSGKRLTVTGVHTRANAWRSESGANGCRHKHPLQEEIFARRSGNPCGAKTAWLSVPLRQARVRPVSLRGCSSASTVASRGRQAKNRGNSHPLQPTHGPDEGSVEVGAAQ